MKHRQPTYWKRYDQVFKRFSSWQIYCKIKELTHGLGKPFEKRGARGPKFKIAPEEYAAYEFYQIIRTNASFRDMEQDAELFVGMHLDHGTFHKNFMKIPYEYLQRLLRAIVQLLEQLLGYCMITIVDSTGISTKQYEETLIKGKVKLRNKEYKLHTLLASHPDKQTTFYIDAMMSDKHISDAEGAKRLIVSNQTTGYHLGDRGFDAEKVYEAILEKEGIPIIKPKVHKAKMASYKAQGRTCYQEHIYREFRGVIETSYGGLENAGMIQTRCVREDSIAKKGMLAAIRHNLMVYLRAVAETVAQLLELVDKLDI